ncbi:Sec-independent protein translocase protein TatB [Candidatus Kirkpatrickella diaphorinae]|uniref:Sec-independent protein translocase protein TatB n=1 Tax=Candidatus Kirkpatrickella diaphorinae TaxID=2984322 RepID=A0ABY6GJP7_9PROT|nr:Sec-independent protein translocase protein TatB [Candidatus Kirkpatrickella diaphorinae]UYH51549.1 Sec-independent protein translocase protein TatB [Candidatus Kirkpatrickella diaphorinae]
MFDFSWSEVAVVVIIALIFIGPKDLPVAIRSVSRAVKAIRRMASEFQTHVDDFVKEADLDEATSSLKDLHPTKIRDRLLKNIDPDHTLRDGIDVTPPPPSLSSPSHRPTERNHQEVAPEVTRTAPLSDISAPGERAFPIGDIPASLPPATAQRIARESRDKMAPRYLPPVRVMHGGRRVSLDSGGKPAKSRLDV